MNNRQEEYFVALHADGEATRFFVGPIEYGHQHTATGSNSLSELLTTLGELTVEELRNAAVAFGSVVSKESFEAAVPASLQPLVAEATADITFPSTVDAERAAIKAATVLKTRALNVWWDGILGIEVLPGIVLPIDKASIGAMGVAANVCQQFNTDLSIDDINDRSALIPHAQIAQAIGKFYTDYNMLRQAWDTTLAQIESASTPEQVYAVQMPTI